MRISTDIAILILAAGESTRMGQPKQLLPWKDGTLLDNAIKTAKASRAKDIFVILGANSKEIRATILEEKIVVLDNPNWKNGLGSSISKGIEHLIESDKTYDGVLIMLCDQPFISSSYLNQIIRSFKENEGKIIATDYNNRAGVPAIFNISHFKELKQLNDDYGAKKILEQYREDLILIDPKGNELDLDTPEDYRTLIGRSSNTNDQTS